MGIYMTRINDSTSNNALTGIIQCGGPENSDYKYPFLNVHIHCSELKSIAFHKQCNPQSGWPTLWEPTLSRSTYLESADGAYILGAYTSRATDFVHGRTSICVCNKSGAYCLGFRTSRATDFAPSERSHLCMQKSGDYNLGAYTSRATDFARGDALTRSKETLHRTL